MNKTTEALIESISTSSYELGKISGLERVSELLLVRAGERFKEGKDSLAEETRAMAIEIQKMANNNRKEYDNVYKKYSFDAWSILHNCIPNNISFPSDE